MYALRQLIERNLQSSENTTNTDKKIIKKIQAYIIASVILNQKNETTINLINNLYKAYKKTNKNTYALLLNQTINKLMTTTNQALTQLQNEIPSTDYETSVNRRKLKGFIGVET